MKKYLLGTLAIALAVGLSSFEHKDKLLGNDASYYWFHVNAGNGGLSSFLNSEVTVMPGNPSPTAPSSGDCIGSGNKCIVGFEQSQLVAPSYTQLNNPGGLRQPSKSTGQVRTNP